MISETGILAIFGGLMAFAMGYLKLEQNRLKIQLKNLCKECEYDFKPKKEKNYVAA